MGRTALSLGANSERLCLLDALSLGEPLLATQPVRRGDYAPDEFRALVFRLALHSGSTVWRPAGRGCNPLIEAVQRSAIPTIRGVFTCFSVIARNPLSRYGLAAW